MSLDRTRTGTVLSLVTRRHLVRTVPDPNRPRCLAKRRPDGSVPGTPWAPTLSVVAQGYRGVDGGLHTRRPLVLNDDDDLGLLKDVPQRCDWVHEPTTVIRERLVLPTQGSALRGRGGQGRGHLPRPPPYPVRS